MVTRDSLRAEIEQFDGDLPLDQAWTPPSTWYTEGEVYALEKRSVFRGTWQYVARVDQLTEPGSFVAGETAGEPWVVVVGEEGTLRAFKNVCRHKATPVASGCGKTDTLVCPYHGWTYGLDGRLLTAPDIGGIKDFDPEGLPPLSVEVWGPLVFIHGGSPGKGPAAEAGPLADRLDGTDWGGLSWAARKEYTIDCNWKVFCDNYLGGGYHIASLHPSLDAQLDLSSYDTEILDRASIQTSGAAAEASTEHGVDGVRRIGEGALYAFLYPNLMINRYGPALDTNLVLPLGPDRCQVVFDFFFEKDCGEDFIKDSLAQAEVTQIEDIKISGGVQVGLASSSYDRGRYAPGKEVAVHHFHGLLAADLKSALEGSR